MSITDELRERIDDEALLLSTRRELWNIADRIDAEHESKVSYWQDASYKDGYDEGFASADDYFTDKRETLKEHGWVKLPVDADGVPIRVWDKMTGWDSPQYQYPDLEDLGDDEVWGLLLLDDGWRVENNMVSRKPHELRHYHEPTVEDVLREVVTLCHNTWKKESAFHFYGVDDVMESGNIAEYAKRLRLAGEGE